MPFLDSTIGALFAYGADIVFKVVAWFTAQIGSLLDYVVLELVLNMADLVDDMEAIDSLWEIFRDLGNIAFIGVLLYIAIRTILNVGNDFNTKQIMVRLVIVALFVNFSLFAAKVVIDTSNVVALQFYNSIQVEGCEQEEGCNISHFFAGATNISSVQSASSLKSEETIQSAESINFKIFLVRVMGIIFLLVTAFVMGAMALMLIIRFGFLVLLMIASPLAFIAFILPKSKFGQEWWDKLLGQSFFAPALFAMMYITAVLATDLQSGIGEGNTDLMDAILDPNSENLGVFLVFIIMIFLMSASLVVAKKMGAAGATKAIEIGKQTRNWGSATIAGAAAGSAAWAGRQTIGRGAERLSNSRDLKDKAAGSGIGAFAARQTMKLSDKTSKRSFDARNTKAGEGIGGYGKREGGFRQTLEDKTKKREEEKKLIESLSPEEQAKVEKAKMKKDQADNLLEKKEKEIKRNEKQVKTQYEDRKESNQSEYESEMNDIQANEEQTKSELSSVSDNLKQVSAAIKQRDELGDKLEQARGAGDRRMTERISARIDSLTDDIDGVDNIAELDQKEDQLAERQNQLKDRQSDLQDRKKATKKTYTERKDWIRNDYIEQRDDLKDQRNTAKEAVKDIKKMQDEIIKIGDQRGEAFVESMLEQESIIDSAMTKASSSVPDRYGGEKIRNLRDGIPRTAQTRANRQFSVENVGDIDPKGPEVDGKTRQQRVSRKL